MHQTCAVCLSSSPGTSLSAKYSSLVASSRVVTATHRYRVSKVTPILISARKSDPVRSGNESRGVNDQREARVNVAAAAASVVIIIIVTTAAIESCRVLRSTSRE